MVVATAGGGRLRWRVYVAELQSILGRSMRTYCDFAADNAAS